MKDVLIWVSILAALGVMVHASDTVNVSLIGDYRFVPDRPFANEVSGALPDIEQNPSDPACRPLLTGQEVPAGGNATGWALAWTKHVPQVGYAGMTEAGTRIPADERLSLRGSFTLWIRVLYGGEVRGGGGYNLLTLDGPDGKPVLEWTTTSDETDLALSLNVAGAGGRTTAHSIKSEPSHIKLLASRWYDLALTFDGGKAAFFATALGRSGPGQTQAQEIALGKGLSLAQTNGPLWILKGTNSAVESLRVYQGKALTTEEVAALSAGVRIPGPKKTERVDVGTDRQLFLDDAVIERMEGGVKRRFHAAQKHPGNPVLRKTQPKEIEGLGPMFWGSVIYDRDERIFKLWHQALTFHQPEIFNHLYATSEDGIEWTKPKLDIVGPDNRYNPPGYGVGHAGMWLTLRKDLAEKDPEKRYKGFIQHDPLWHVTSPDGFTWTNQGMAAHFTDDTSTAVYHSGRDEYVKIGRFCPDGRSMALRLMMACTSPGPLAEGNTPWHLVMLPDERDLSVDPWMQYYHMPAFAYEGVYVGLLGIYYSGPESGASETELTFSRDGLNWHRVNQGTPFIAKGRPGSWDAGFGVVPGTGPVEVGDELWFYYAHYDGGHHGGYTKGGIGLARLRRDGFVSLSAGGKGGAVMTKRFTLAGDTVEINAAAEGGLTVQVLDRSGKMMAQGRSFTGDDCHHRVTWEKGADLSALRGEEVALRFLLRDAEIYAFQVGDRRSLEARAKARASGYLVDEDPWETWKDRDKIERVTNPNARKAPIEMEGKPVAAFLFDACSAGLVESGDIIDVTEPSSSSPAIVGKPEWTDTKGVGSGQGIVFDGSSCLDFKLGAEKELAFSSDQLRVVARVRIEQDGGGVIASRDSWPDDRGWYLDIMPDGAVRFAVAKSPKEGGYGPKSEAGAIAPGAFHDVEAVFDRGRIRISVDGEVVARADTSDTFTSVSAAGEDTPCLVGASIYQGQRSGLLDGTIESLSIYATVLVQE